MVVLGGNNTGGGLGNVIGGLTGGAGGALGGLAGLDKPARLVIRLLNGFASDSDGNAVYLQGVQGGSCPV